MSGPYLHTKDGVPVLGDGFYEQIAQRLREARKLRQMSQKALSKASGLSVDSISRYERIRGPMHLPDLLKLCQALKITPNWVLYGSESTRYAHHVQENLLTHAGEIDHTEQIVRMSTLFHALHPQQRRAIEITLTAMLRANGFSDDDVNKLTRVSDTLSAAFKSNPYLDSVINALALRPDIIAAVEEMLKETPPDDPDPAPASETP